MNQYSFYYAFLLLFYLWAAVIRQDALWKIPFATCSDRLQYKMTNLRHFPWCWQCSSFSCIVHYKDYLVSSSVERTFFSLRVTQSRQNYIYLCERDNWKSIVLILVLWIRIFLIYEWLMSLNFVSYVWMLQGFFVQE